MITKIVPATQDHVDAMKGKLRAVDEQEVRATSGMSADDSMSLGLKRSTLCWVLLADEKPVAIFGVVPQTVLGTIGVPWLLATNDLPKFTKEVVKSSRPYIEKMLNRFPYLQNWSDERNVTARRWLKWCGFIFGQPELYGVERRKFSRFYMMKRG